MAKGLGCTLLNLNREAGFAWRRFHAGSILMERISRTERTREDFSLINGDLGTAAGRGDLVRLALRLIVLEALEGEVADELSPALAKK